jgi:hypothetical protein
VEVEPTFSAFRDGQVLQDLGLESGAESFGLFDAIVHGGCLQLRERGDAEIPVQTQHFLRAETGYGKQLEHTLGNLLPQLFEARMSAALVKLGYDVSDRLADAGDFHKPVFGDEHVQRDWKGPQAVGGPSIGFCSVGVATTQGRALCVFSQETCDRASVEGRHLASLPFRARRRRSKATLRGWAVIGPTIERCLKFLRCPEVVKVLCVRSVSGPFFEEIINSARHQLQMLHPAPRHRSGFAKSPDGVGAEVIKSVRHDLGKRPALAFCRRGEGRRPAIVGI